MIHVDPQSEPSNFDGLVRQPGQRFLAENPRPNVKEWPSHSYWRKILESLHNSYKGICAYSCHWIPYDTGADTVEHFLPKNKYPEKAYEWHNYRLICATLNGRKGGREDIFDPFKIQNGWFTIIFPTLLVKPAQNIDQELVHHINTTIDCLGLNDNSTCLKSRENYIKHYCQGNITFEFLLVEAPFIAQELRRQNLVTSIKEMMVYDQAYD